jgi:hypothetical protein
MKFSCPKFLSIAAYSIICPPLLTLMVNSNIFNTLAKYKVGGIEQQK